MGKVVGSLMALAPLLSSAARPGVAVFPPGAVPPPSAASRRDKISTQCAHPSRNAGSVPKFSNIATTAECFHGATDVLVLHRVTIFPSATAT
jgi:hypothetical protein